MSKKNLAFITLCFVLIGVASYIYFGVTKAPRKMEMGTHPVNESAEFDSFPKTSALSSAGVVIYYQGSNGWIKNNNEFSIRIDGTCIEPAYRISKWLLDFEPGQVKSIIIYPTDRYYIYQLDGKPIGTIFLSDISLSGLAIR